MKISHNIHNRAHYIATSTSDGPPPGLQVVGLVFFKSALDLQILISPKKKLYVILTTL